ncbi:MAG: gliding motility-associated C-terminal domain-containing protein [Crocinitomicaceae bacterium]|nr:gliding motility-associated C-terminal domain-containing protein [Flavobacteriales bacterium]NQZ35912.1 gliding motility-associated C-terminal domain-containing protein [Crocinitomicaceae bacterium]
MKILKIVLGALLITSMTPSLIAQCNLSTTPQVVTIDCGSPVNISALGLSPTPALATTFDGGVIGPGWSTTAIMLYNNPCGPTLDGTPGAWFGNVPLPRTLTTNGFDLSCGAQICFDIDFAGDDACGGCSDCEDPDLLDEGVFFRYSIDAGVTWVDIFYFQTNSANNTPYYQWTNNCFILPPEAWTTSTMFQWDQPAISSSVNDHWGIDNVTITPTDCNYWYDWAHVPGFPDDADQVVSPNDTTTYYITYTDGIVVCLDSVVVNVLPLEIDIIGNPNPLDCGSCSDVTVEFLNGNNGSIVDDFEGGFDPLTWGDIQSGTASTICGGGGTGDALYFDGTGSDRYAETVGVDATTCGNIDFCLFMGNTASGGAPCENNETGEDIILEYSIDAGVTFLPIATYAQSLWDGANFQQCFSETMPLAAQTTSTIFRWRQVAFGAFAGSDNWSLDDVVISCNPPTILYNWTTGTVDDITSATPLACPSSTELYTVSMMNTITGCNATDTSTLFVNECVCFFMQFDGAVVCQPGGVFDVTGTFEYSHSPTTGTIEVEATNGTGTYSQTFNAPFTDSLVFNYSITGITNDGSTTTMLVYFSDSLSCNQTFDITPPALPTVTAIAGGDTYCVGDVVTPITVDVTGTGPWTVSYTLNGITNTSTSATSPVSLGTEPGVYVLTGVADQICLNAAVGTETVVLNPLPIVNAGADQALCDGGTTMVSGSGAATYAWTNGVIDATTFTPPVGTTTYDVTGTDANGCVNVSSMTIVVTAYPPAPVVSPQGGDYCASSLEIPPFVATGGGQVFTWYADASLVNVITTGTNLQPLIIEGTTNYYVTQSTNGCEGPPASIGIFLENCEATIVMPNVFTPNPDATNSLFHPVYMDGVTKAETTILNRWGNVIYVTDDLAINWNGLNSSGKEVQEGTYFWKMVYSDLNGDEFIIHGNVQVIR